MAEIDYAFLADAAQVQQDQKFSVLGGGVSRIAGPAVPFVHPHLALVLGLRLGSAERGREHEIGFRLVDPEGGDVASGGGRIVAQGPADPADIILNIAVDLWSLNLRLVGEHSVRITVDGTERKRLPLFIAVAREATPEQRYLA
jgi:hypothetical protein